MKFRSTILLLAVALGIGAYIWFFEKKQMSTQEREQKEKLVFSVSADDIDRIEVSREKGTVVCARDKAGEWNLEKPLAYKADKARIRGMLSRLEGLKSERVIPGAGLGEKELEEFGLKEPRLTARFRARGKDLGLEIGADTPLGETAYARVDGSKDVQVIAKGVYGALAKEAVDLRDRGVIDFNQADLSKVAISRGGKSIDLVQEGEAWKIVSPITTGADPEKVGALLRKLRNLRVRDFVDDAPKQMEKYGLAAPEAEIALRGRGDEAVGAVVFGMEAEKGARYARAAGREAVFTVGNDIMKEIVSDPADLRDKMVTRLGEAEVDEIRIEGGGRKLSMSKAGDRWEIREPEKKDAEAEQVRALLKAALNLKASEFAAEKASAPEKYGLGAEALSLTLKTKDGKEEKILFGGKYERGKKVYVKRASGDEVLGVEAAILAQCVPDPLPFLKREVVDINSRDAKGLVISGTKVKKTVCEKEDGAWNLVEPKKGKADPGAVAAILANISHLRAAEFVARAPKDLKPYGLDEPSVEVAVECEKGGSSETTILKIGGKAKDGLFYAALGGGDLVFTIPGYIEESLRKDLAAKPAPTPADAKADETPPAQSAPARM